MPSLALRMEHLPTGYREAPRLAIDGTALQHCTPEIAHVDLDDRDLSIVLHQPRIGCGSTEQPFSLRVQSVSVDGFSLVAGQVYRVRIYVDSGTGAEPVLFQLLETPGGMPVRPENGFWWSVSNGTAALRGTGIGVERQGDELALALYGFGDDGSPVWQFGSAVLKGRTARISLVELAGGDPVSAPIGSVPQALQGPRLELEFRSPGTASGWLVRSEGGRDADVQPLDFARAPFSEGEPGRQFAGRWVLVPDEGAARVLELADAGLDGAMGVHLVDAATGAQLDCRLAEGRAVPDLCSLATDGAPVADFDRIGLDRLDGRAANGGSVTLMRVSR